MAAKTRRTATETQHFAAPAGCLPHERADWLPDLPVPFVRELRTRHVELAQAWARAVDQIAAVRDERAQGERDYRQMVRDAVAQSAAVPPRPADLDPALLEGRVSVALEDSQVARDDLAEHVLECLAQLRACRTELGPHLGRLSPQLLGALSCGSGNQRAIVVERLRRQAEELAADGPAIEVFDDDDTSSTPELERAHHA